MSAATNDPIELQAARIILADLVKTPIIHTAANLGTVMLHGPAGHTMSLGRVVQLAQQALDAKPEPPRFGTSQVPETVVITIDFPPAGQVDIYLNFMTDAERQPGRPNPSVTLVGTGQTPISPDAVKVEPTWRDPDDEELGAVVAWPVLRQLAGLLGLLAKGTVPANLAQQAATVLAQLDVQVAQAVQR